LNNWPEAANGYTKQTTLFLIDENSVVCLIAQDQPMKRLPEIGTVFITRPGFR